ncbi:MAG: hypothetical protein ACTHUY_07365 [Flaviflexus sp.]|uniref:hypothetical protein n=1 Tax=Flaviflexus sp. TaxID=1969482 RepID=UPI003F912CE6
MSAITLDPVRTSLAVTGTVFAHYAMPDFVKSKFLRFIGKTAVNSALVAWTASHSSEELGQAGEQLQEFLDSADAETLKSTAGIAAGATLGTTVIAVAGEKWLYRRAEKKRAEGKHLAHTKQALVLAVLTGAVTYAAEMVDA